MGQCVFSFWKQYLASFYNCDSSFLLLIALWIFSKMLAFISNEKVPKTWPHFSPYLRVKLIGFLIEQVAAYLRIQPVEL